VRASLSVVGGVTKVTVVEATGGSFWSKSRNCTVTASLSLIPPPSKSGIRSPLVPLGTGRVGAEPSSSRPPLAIPSRSAAVALLRDALRNTTLEPRSVATDSTRMRLPAGIRTFGSIVATTPGMPAESVAGSPLIASTTF
jgi:hypothetical protein